jgi:branched-chain amino acid transport system ATP-binding protein
VGGVIAPVLDVRDVTLRFAGVIAVNGVSFTVETGELLAVIGPNGAGKTSLFNMVSGVYRPQQGSVHFDGQDVMLGRHLHLRYGALAALLWRGRARREEIAHREAVEHIIDFLELVQWRTLPVGLLPYGVQKRVELGRALAMDPKLLLLDEPAAGMNLEETQDLARFILDIRDELGISMVMVEHDMGLVMDLADRLLAIDFGTPLALGTPAEVAHDPAVIQAYLGQGASA